MFLIINMKLVIVESPAKCSKIAGFLGKDYIVKASYGHFRDLKKRELGIDVDDNFKPEYMLSDDKAMVIKELKNAMKKCDELILATDNDREGEAIAFHLDYLLNKGKLNSKRVLFNEITKSALVSAVSNPTKIDINLFYAQQARRIIDRLVGFTLTPILWKNIQMNYSKGKTLSAGRVQSVVNKLIYEKEQTIKAFEKSPYFNIKGNLDFKGNSIPVKLVNKVTSYKKTNSILQQSKTTDFIVKDIKKKESIENPRPPFITSSLQTEAYNKLSMSSKVCMMVAQKLYENGHITYMRTDSTVLSQDAHEQIKMIVEDKYGKEYYRRKNYSNKKNAQEAHECCRPTNIDLLPEKFTSVENNEKRLYDLIWKRCVGSQMQPSKKDVLDVKIGLDKEIFQSSYDKLTFPGFLILYDQSGFTNKKKKTKKAKKTIDKPEPEKEDNPNDEPIVVDANNPLNKLSVGDKLTLLELIANEKYTTPETRYNDGSLVKKLEELGIGRPSTYASMINGVLDKHLVTKTQLDGEDVELRNIVVKQKTELIETKEITKYGKDIDKLMTTEMGIIVHDFLDKWFENIVNYQFTANLEKQLDIVASGKLDWVDVVRDIYKLVTSSSKYTDLKTKQPKEKVSKILGINPDNDCEISINLGQYGLYLKEIHPNSNIKDRNVSLKEERIDEITLEKAIELLRYPKDLGLYNKKMITINNGPYGIYLKYDGGNYSINELTINELTMDTVKQLIKDKISNTSSTNNIIKEISDKIKILNGKYGPYIRYNDSKNYSIYLDKKTYDTDEKRKSYLENLTKEDCKKIINKPVKKK